VDIIFLREGFFFCLLYVCRVYVFSYVLSLSCAWVVFLPGEQGPLPALHSGQGGLVGLRAQGVSEHPTLPPPQLPSSPFHTLLACPALAGRTGQSRALAIRSCPAGLPWQSASLLAPQHSPTRPRLWKRVLGGQGSLAIQIASAGKGRESALKRLPSWPPSTLPPAPCFRAAPHMAAEGPDLEGQLAACRPQADLRPLLSCPLPMPGSGKCCLTSLRFHTLRLPRAPRTRGTQHGGVTA